MRLPLKARRDCRESRRLVRVDFPEREGLETEGASVCSLHNAAPLISTRTACDVPQHDTFVGDPIVHDHAREDVTDFSPARCSNGGPLRPPRNAPNDGAAEGADRRLANVLGSFDREDIMAIPQLRSGLRTDGGTDGECRQGFGGAGSRRVDDGHGQRHGGVIGVVGLKAPTWEALRGTRAGHRSSSKSLDAQSAPLHIKAEVIGSLDVQTLLKTHDSADLRESLKWIDDSPIYSSLRSHLQSFALPTARSALSSEDISQLMSAQKLTFSNSVSAFCNAFTVEEDKPEGVRRRPIIEPLLNRIIEEYWQDECKVCYTPKSVIRALVLKSPCAVQYDFSAWFDQISLHPRIRDLFGVPSTQGDMVLNVLPMGFKPSCRVAQAVTEALVKAACKVTRDIGWAACVDNVAFFGSFKQTSEVANAFLSNCAKVRACIKDTTVSPQTRYEFLGEWYDHQAKSRALTLKTQAKAAFVFNLLQQNPHKYYTVRQLLAIFGLLLYAANVLDIDVASHHYAMRFLSYVASKPLYESMNIPARPMDHLLCWSACAALNRPVFVHKLTPQKIDLCIYVDASGLGWGALAIGAATQVKSCAFSWPRFMASSVDAEPLAVKLAAAYFIDTSYKRVVIYTDHIGFVYAYQKGWGKCAPYSHAVSALRQWQRVGVMIEVQHIPGKYNPADALSRSFTPPLLPVTKIGDKVLGKGSGTWDGARLACSR